MRVGFFVDAGAQIGTGHLSRCLTLADHGFKLNHSSVFFLSADSLSYCEKIEAKGFKVHFRKVSFEKVGSKINKIDYAKSVCFYDDMHEFLSDTKPDLCIADSYYLNEEWAQFVKKTVPKVGFIDDLANRKLGGDFIIDQNPDATEEKYIGLVGRNTVQLLGTEYAILGSQFKQYRKKSIKNKKNGHIKVIFINFGGSDPENYTEKTVRVLLKYHKIKFIKLFIICGLAYNFKKSISDLLKESGVDYKLIFDCQNMAELMANSDIAIGAGGITALERCCMGLPTLQLILAKNQHKGTKALMSKGAIKYVPDINKIGNVLDEFDLCSYGDMSKVGLCLVDGNGATKVIKRLEVIVEN